MKRILIAPVRFYQRFISPAFPPSCRFEPTCSNYMIQAIEKHGFKGVLMGLARILRCHPWSKTGKDPVPDHFTLKRNSKSDCILMYKTQIDDTWYLLSAICLCFYLLLMFLLFIPKCFCLL